MKLNQEIVEIAAETACSHIELYLSRDYVFHDLAHTVSVVEGVTELSKRLKLSRSQRMILIVAAWFHDTGYSIQNENHELPGSELAEKFLRTYEIDEEEIKTIRDCILSTRYPQKPQTLLQRIICDADLIHLASRDFPEHSKRLRDEWRLVRHRVYTDQE